MDEHHRGTRGIWLTIGAIVVVGHIIGIAIALFGADLIPPPSSPSSAPATGPAPVVVDGQTVTPRWTPPPTQAPTATARRTPGPLFPTSVGGYNATPVPDQAKLAAGAKDAQMGEYVRGGTVISAAQSTWPSQESAVQAAARERAAAEASGARFNKQGNVGAPSRGTYWYYDVGQDDGLLVWTDGDRMGTTRGPAMEMQHLYLDLVR